jgi:hypothetical protein
MDPSETPRRRVVEESLGEAVVRSIDAFVFRDIEDDATSVAVFDFVVSAEARDMLGAALRGVRWQQKVGLVLARHRGHPAHAAQIRSQVIEYGAISELALRESVRQAQPAGVPATFQGLIERAEDIGVLDEVGAAAANRRRLARNTVHLDPSVAPPKVADAAKAMRDFVTIVNKCRSHAGLAKWKPVRRSPE